MHNKQESGLFKEEFMRSEMICLCSKIFCCYDSKSDKFKFSSECLNKRAIEVSANGPMSKYRRVFDEAVILTSTNRGFSHVVASFEQTKKGLSYLYPKRQVQDDEIH